MKRLEHHHLIDGKYLKEDCLAGLATTLLDLVPSALHERLQAALDQFEDECVHYDRSKDSIASLKESRTYH